MKPRSRPKVNATPPSAGPIARPMAEMDTAKPLRVPRIRSETAEFVSRMMEQGKANMTAKDLTSMIPNMTVCCHAGFSIRAVKGVEKQISGKTIAQHLKQFKTPKRRAVGGKMMNWMKQPQIPYNVKRVPMRPEARPKPPENLSGRWMLGELGDCFGVCRNMGRS